MTAAAAPAASRITAGEWRAVAWSSHARTTIVSEADGHYIVVAECSGHGRLSSDSLADAQLMAAAKKLLAAAQAAWQCISELSPTQARVEVAQVLQAAIEQAGAGES